MRKLMQALVLASAFAGGALFISPLHAQEPSPGASKGTGMMEGGNMMGGSDTTGGGNMTTMMNMMTQMNADDGDLQQDDAKLHG